MAKPKRPVYKQPPSTTRIPGLGVIRNPSKPNVKPPAKPGAVKPKPNPGKGKPKPNPKGKPPRTRKPPRVKKQPDWAIPPAPDFTNMPGLPPGAYDPINASAYANQLAGLQYDQQIRNTGIERERSVRQGQQNQRDINTWYEQVTGSLAKARERDQAINQAARAGMRSASEDIVGAFGGEANPAGSDIARAGQEGLDLLTALGSSQEMYNSDMAPILQTERAGALGRQRALDVAATQDLANQVLGLQGERGRARSAAELDLKQYNKQLAQQRLEALMGIRQANNELLQQSYNNSIGALNTRAGLKMSDIELEAAQRDLKNRPGGKASPAALWQQMGSSGQLVTLQQHAQSQMFNTTQVDDGQGGTVEQMVPATPQEAISRIHALLRSALGGKFPTDPQVRGQVRAWRDSMLRSAGIMVPNTPLPNR